MAGVVWGKKEMGEWEGGAERRGLPAPADSAGRVVGPIGARLSGFGGEKSAVFSEKARGFSLKVRCFSSKVRAFWSARAFISPCAVYRRARFLIR